MSDSIKLDPVWCEVECASCGLESPRVKVYGWIEEHRTERSGAWRERHFETDECEECVCGAIPDDPPLEELAMLYDRAVGAEEPHGWLTSSRRARRRK